MEVAGVAIVEVAKAAVEEAVVAIQAKQEAGLEATGVEWEAARAAWVGQEAG